MLPLVMKEEMNLLRRRHIEKEIKLKQKWMVGQNTTKVKLYLLMVVVLMISSLKMVNEKEMFVPVKSKV